MQTLKQKTISAFVWSLFDKVGLQILTFVGGIILARFFLNPADYGLMGMLAIFIALSSILIDGGFGLAIIRKSNITHLELNSIYIFSIFLSLILYTALYFIFPLIASFYNQPILVPIGRVATLIILINAFTNIQHHLFAKELKFKQITQANMIAAIVSLIITIVIAYKGYGVWALVWQNIIFVFIRNCIIWYLSSWRPSFEFEFACIKSFWAFSMNVLFAGILNAIFNNIFTLLIGKYYPLKEVGYYSQANKFSDLSSGTISSAIQTVSYPIMSQVNNDDERQKQVCRKIVRVTSFLSFLILFGLSAIAFPLIQLLLTDKWISIVPYMRILCIGGAFLPLLAININILYVKGYSRKVLYFEIIRKTIIIICILFSIKFGVLSLIIGLVVSTILGYTLSVYNTSVNTNYKFFEQLKDIMPYLIIAGFMFGCMYLLSLVIVNMLLLLIIQVIVGGAVYLFITYILGSKIFREILELIKPG